MELIKLETESTAKGAVPVETIAEPHVNGSGIAEPASETKMSARNLCVFYGDKQALFDIDMDIPERSVTALIGPSGCGKSTFIRCLNRMNDTIDEPTPPLPVIFVSNLHMG